ncbi:hypothetical protein DITRI_Ditri02bG0039300 [Diplodiscus trichospermus]
MDIMWEEVASVAAIRNHTQPLMISCAASSAPPTQSSLGQPFLAKLTINNFKHGKCSATVIDPINSNHNSLDDCRHQEDYASNLSPVNESVWIKAIRVATNACFAPKPKSVDQA